MMNYDTLNSLTKYPSIPTYHVLGERGVLTEEMSVAFTGNVIPTEKVDGTNGRFVVTPDGDYFIGSRENLLHAKGDRLFDRAQRIVETLLPMAPALRNPHPSDLLVFYLEVYGHNIQAAWKQYTGGTETGCRLFDVARIPMDALEMAPEEASSWRDHGGQSWYDEPMLHPAAENAGIELTPRLGVHMAESLPTTVEDMNQWLTETIPYTRAALGPGSGGRAEGIVLRSSDRSSIAKIRFQDYTRTLRARGKAK